MTIFGLTLLQLFIVVLVIALAVVVAEQIRKHGLDPFLTTLKAAFVKAETAVVDEGKTLLADFEKLLNHAKSTAAALPAGSEVTAKAGASQVTITTPPAPVVQGPAPLDPVAAVTQYIKGGMTTAIGMPNLYNLQWLLSLSKSARFAWAVAVAAAFAAQLPAPPAGTNAFTATLDDVGTAPDTPIRPEAQAYLAEVCQGYPIVGTWNWTRS